MASSMTGFGRGLTIENGMEFTVEIKSVNHRYMDISIRIPRQLGFLEEKIRETVNANFSRGKIDVFVNYSNKGRGSETLMLDESLAQSYMSSAESLCATLGLNNDLTVSTLIKLPDVVKIEEKKEDEDYLWSILKVALSDAIEGMRKMRKAEGNRLTENIKQTAKAVRANTGLIRERAPLVVKDYRQRLLNRISELTEQQVPDEGRIATETAIYADRCSIDEELVRLDSHFEHFSEMLADKKPIGKKLDFLIQEMNREINTIGSKANDISITKNIIEMKNEMEKIREQVQNLE